MDGHQVAMNRTRLLEALSAYLENPRQIVIRNEAFVVLAAAMLFLQLMLGPWRRRSGHWFVQGTLWVAYMASFPLITYTLGQMVTSPVKNMMYPVWALILFWASGCANAMMAYNIEDNKRWKQYLFELLQYFVYTVVIFQLLRSGRYPERMPSLQPINIPLAVLMSMLFMTNVLRVVACWMVTNSTPSKVVAEYMRAQVQVNTTSAAAQQEETFTMNNYKYLVRPNLIGRNNASDEDCVITIKEIWSKFDDGSLLGKQTRDVCLSFALSHLLRRRYFQMDCVEAGLPKTLKFALEGLLLGEYQVNHYSGAFHVIEVELGFLYDFFFTRHATFFYSEGPFIMLVVLKLICTPIAGILLLVHPPIVNTLDPILEVGTRRVDVTATVGIMGALFLFEVLQAILYLSSDWATVSLACSYVRGDTCTFIPSIIRFLRRFKFENFLGRRINVFGYWQNKMAQSSLIGGNLIDSGRIFVNTTARRGNTLDFFQFHQAICNIIYSMIFTMKNFVAVPNLAKSKIVSCLRIYAKDGGSLTNGKASLKNNRVLGDFSSSVENDSQIEVMLIWHIATEYCNIASSDGAEGLQSDEQHIAVTLSKYCAYLMYFVPELLAENSTDTLFIVHKVLEQVEDALGGDKPTKDRLLRVIQDSNGPNNHATTIDINPVISNTDNINYNFSGSSRTDNIISDSDGSTNGHTTIAQNTPTNNNEDSILVKGLKLGRELEVKDVDLRWKVMAEFWAETIIYIAPSDKAAEHMERLAQGGEFLTHVWALLTHAGIVKRDQVVPKLEKTPIPDACV